MKKSLSFQIKLLKQCNLRCSYCYEQNHFENSHSMSLSEIKTLLGRIKSYAIKEKIGCVRLCYTGGEVLTLGKGFLEKVFRLSRKTFEKTTIRPKLQIQTNFTLIDKKFIEILKKYDVGVGMSFDVYGGQRRFRGGRSVDLVLIDKMIMALKENLHFGVIVVLTKSNYKKAQKIYNLFNKAGLGFHFLTLHPWAEKFCPDQIVDLDEYIKQLKKIAKGHLAKGSQSIMVRNIDSYVDLLLFGDKCSHMCVFSRSCLSHLIFIENNGDVFPCCSLRYKDLFLGNIFSDSLTKILNSPIRKRLMRRYQFIKKECKGCQYLKICNGGCMAYAYMEGNVLGPSKAWCTINKAMFKYIGKILERDGEKLVINK
ncbi:MAG: radical SAM protein [Candidatus Saganbacteria bacterium]|nr:radical SAM protein [Candidatus Saganbacteria bacterium]